MRMFAAGLSAFVCTALGLAAALRLFPHLGLLDFPERYGLRRPRIPYPAGIVAVLVFLMFFLGLGSWKFQNVGVAAAVSLLALVCFQDDRRPLPPLVRLIAQILVSLIVFVTGSRIYTLTNPLAGFAGGSFIPLDTLRVVIPLQQIGTLPVLSGIFTILWLGLTINALNWFDGIPGQVSVIATLGFLTIGLLSLSTRVGQPEVATLSFLLAGIAAACMLFDLPPPRLLLGDTGAMFFGLMIGVLTIYAGGKVATAFLVLGVPLLDFFLVFLRRLASGRSPLRGSMQGEHLHHRLLEIGWKPKQIILLTAGIGGAFGSTALFLSTFGKFVAALLLFLIVAGLSLYAGRVISLRTSSDRSAR